MVAASAVIKPMRNPGASDLEKDPSRMTLPRGNVAHNDGIGFVSNHNSR